MVCVTGASGFIGAWVVRVLLERGYAVAATVQNLKDAAETEHLHAIAAEVGHAERLQLRQMELLDYDSVEAAMAGCVGVFHLACPNVIGRVEDPQTQLVEPSVQGTLHVLRAASAASSPRVRRVVLTSSISAMIPNPGWTPGVPVNEECWADEHFLRDNGLWYPMAKLLAEKATWEHVNKTGLDVVAINPGTVLGPIGPPVVNSSMAMLQGLLGGCPDTYGNFWMGCVHVRDAARAHVMLFEKPEASGRHLCLARIFPYSKFAATVKRLFPEYPVPDLTGAPTCVWNAVDVAVPATKLAKLGMTFSDVEVAIKDAVASLKSKGFLDGVKVA